MYANNMGFFFAFLAYNVGIKKNPDFFLDTLII